MAFQAKSETASSQEILLIRLDRLGDLLVTLPVDQIPELVSSKITWAIPEGLGTIVARATPPRTYFEFSRDFRVRDFRRFVEFARGFKRAVVFQAPWWVGLGLWLARVPIRVGVLSQWHSFLFFNRGVRQKRSRAEIHEYKYGVKLAAEGLGFLEPPEEKTLDLQKPPFEALQKRLSISPGYVVVHPGMGGSARNWPVQKYSELISTLASQETVVVTGTLGDHPWTEPIKAAVGTLKNVHWLQETLSGDEMIAVLAHAKAVVVPSTGTAHVAASLGVPVIGLYSPVHVQRAVRWAPRGKFVKVLEPRVDDCPGHHHCLGEACSRFDCMNTIDVQEVIWHVQNISK